MIGDGKAYVRGEKGAMGVWAGGEAACPHSHSLPSFPLPTPLCGVGRGGKEVGYFTMDGRAE